MRQTDDRVPKVVITEAAPAALAGANTRRKGHAQRAQALERRRHNRGTGYDCLQGRCYPCRLLLTI